MTYHLLTNPEKLAILTKEIRSHFAQDADINLQSTAGLEYLNACTYLASSTITTENRLANTKPN